MPGVPGKTNNPNGRPPNKRSLTAILDRYLSKTVEVNGKRISGKRVLASLVTQVLTTGRLQFPGDVEASIVSVKDWLEYSRWAYQYLEPPINKNEHTGAGGGPLRAVVEYVNDWRRIGNGND